MPAFPCRPGALYTAARNQAAGLPASLQYLQQLAACPLQRLCQRRQHRQRLVQQDEGSDAALDAALGACETQAQAAAHPVKGEMQRGKLSKKFSAPAECQPQAK